MVFIVNVEFFIDSFQICNKGKGKRRKVLRKGKENREEKRVNTEEKIGKKEQKKYKYRNGERGK